jgi:hypothetical protein
VDNPFIRFIYQGKIRNLGDLKRLYRRMVMQTHPDAVGSDRLADRYIEYSNFYAEARDRFATAENDTGIRPDRPPENYRLLFYKEFYKLERIDKPYAFNKHYHTGEEIELAKQRSYEYFSKWKPHCIDLYRQANTIYDQIKKEKPTGPYRKYALLFNLSPVFHNILSYQLTGLQFYRKQLTQNFAGVMLQLEKRGFDRLIEYIELLIRDMERGPAILESVS